MRVIRVRGRNSDVVGWRRADEIPVGVHRVDRHVESRAGDLVGGRAVLACGGARGDGFARHQQLQLGKRTGVDRDRRTGVGGFGPVGFTVMAGLVLAVTPVWVMSEAVTVLLPAVFNVTSKVCVPATNAVLPGRLALESLEVMPTTSLVAIKFQLASTALTVTVKAV